MPFLRSLTSGIVAGQANDLAISGNADGLGYGSVLTNCTNSKRRNGTSLMLAANLPNNDLPDRWWSLPTDFYGYINYSIPSDLSIGAPRFDCAPAVWMPRPATMTLRRPTTAPANG